MSTAPRYVPHYTVEDRASWEGNWELIDGIPIAMSPSPFGPHERVVSRLSRMIGIQLENHGCDCEVYTNLDWIITSVTVVRPDLMVVCGTQPSRHLEHTPIITVEVLSDSTRQQDLGVKRELYLENGVSHYLLLDPEQSTVELCSAAGSNLKAVPNDSPLFLDVGSHCQLQIDTTRLFD